MFYCSHKRSILCDVKLAATGDKRKIKAHKIVLMTHSLFFESLFRMQRVGIDQVTLEELNFDQLQTAINYMYAAESELRDQQIHQGI